MTFLGIFDFVKNNWNLDIFDREPKYACALFACVLRFYVFSKNISTHLTLICLKCVLLMKENLYKAISVTSVERSSRLNDTGKNINKNSICIILVPTQRY